MTTPLAELADDLLDEVLRRDPFTATEFGLPGYDADVPDLSAEGDAIHLATLARLRARAGALDTSRLTASERITIAAVVNTLNAQATLVETAAVEHTVGTGYGAGPSRLLMVAATASAGSPQAAADLLARTRGYGRYLDTCVVRLRLGAASGRLPVATLTEAAVRQVDGYLAEDASDVFAAADLSSRELRAVVSDELQPALRRWRAAVIDLPSRDDAHCGLVHLPGGAEDYDRLVQLHTTLPLTAQEVHDLGHEQVARLIEEAVSLGASLGLRDFTSVSAAARRSPTGVHAEAAMAVARAAIQRAERACIAVFPPPLPTPCAVEPMSAHLGRAGTPAHYTAPSADGNRPGTYWFNVDEPGMAAGWALEVTAFHEGVPGHHLQLARSGTRMDLPALQRYAEVMAHGEGWGLYAETLAGELGLFSNIEARVGAVCMSLFRAARLVVDTGIHALGWSRDEALGYLIENTPLPEETLRAEVNRYIGEPGQALSYMVGQRELLRLRQHARSSLGDDFDLAGFHGAVLDHGQLPLPAVKVAVQTWIDAVLGARP